MRKISITEALNELKLYDAKITKAICNGQFVGTAKKSGEKVGAVGKNIFVERAKASYQSAVDLISNRNALKSAIVKSNAETMVTIDGKTMTRAAAIERKTSIEYEESLLAEMRKQYTNAVNAVTRENARVDSKVDELIATLVAKETTSKSSKDDQESVERLYREKNEWELVDPINLLKEIERLDADIAGFKSAVDTCLVVSNSTSFIEVDF